MHNRGPRRVGGCLEEIIFLSALDKPVLIIGGGVAGLAAALELDRRGLASLVVEKGPNLGGQARGFCCKALEVCARCGACRVGDLLQQAAQRPALGALTQALAVAAQRQGAGWEVTLIPQEGPKPTSPALALERPLGERLLVQTGAVILAVGHQVFDARKKSRLGYGRVPGVMTAGELEETLAKGGLPGQARRLAFVQCVGSRDQALGRLYCSRVCCGFALRLARLARYLEPGSEVTFFHMDVQDYGQAWRAELAEMRAGMRFIRAIPGEVRPGAGGPLAVFAGPDGQPQEEEFDLVVLATGLEPPVAAPALSEMFGLTPGAEGFLTGGQGVLVAGSAGGPRSIAESIESAAQAAASAAEHLVSGQAPSPEVAHA
ncbi:MAG: CoB--CoM heterodisulfide reductase iron-sulfur subunit A family protein [Desulfarculus sp.]|nr:CoB--CoM heterodisulfide reductase iron-sulfur subunit A family protein [Desulfarculus sp.]